MDGSILQKNTWAYEKKSFINVGYFFHSFIRFFFTRFFVLVGSFHLITLSASNEISFGRTIQVEICGKAEDEMETDYNRKTFFLWRVFFKKKFESCLLNMSNKCSQKMNG